MIERESGVMLDRLHELAPLLDPSSTLTETMITQSKVSRMYLISTSKHVKIFSCP